jgi:pectinesterase
LRQILLVALIFELLCVVAFSQNQRKKPSLIVVAADGTGDHKTVQQAVDHIPENNQQRILIRIKPGVYNEQIRVSSGKRNLTLRGEDPSNTVLTYRLSAQQAGNTRLAFSTFVNADDFRAENLTFQNSFGTGSQAVALLVDADRAMFLNCRFLGWQDTLFVNGGRQFFKDCYIEGHVDFIFGSASAVFENCTVHSKADGYITAHFRTSDAENTGFVFLRCRFTGSGINKGVYLGRPWRPFARVVFIDCWLDSHIKPEGWDNWRDPGREKTAWFGEYRSKGPGASSKARVAWSKQLTAGEAETFSLARFFSRADHWQPNVR